MCLNQQLLFLIVKFVSRAITDLHSIFHYSLNHHLSCSSCNQFVQSYRTLISILQLCTIELCLTLVETATRCLQKPHVNGKTLPSPESLFSKGGATSSTLLPEIVEFPASSLLVVPFTNSSFGALLETSPRAWFTS